MHRMMGKVLNRKGLPGRLQFCIRQVEKILHHPRFYFGRAVGKEIILQALLRKKDLASVFQLPLPACHSLWHATARWRAVSSHRVPSAGGVLPQPGPATALAPQQLLLGRWWRCSGLPQQVLWLATLCLGSWFSQHQTEGQVFVTNSMPLFNFLFLDN